MDQQPGDEHPGDSGPRSAERTGTLHRRHVQPTLDFFDRLRRQSALLAVADAFAIGPGTTLDIVIEQRLREYTAASDQVLAISGDVGDNTLGWFRPLGSLVLLVPQGCPDVEVVDAVAAGLAAMNAVTLALEPEQHRRLADFCDRLTRFLPEAFAQLDVGPESHYPPGATIVALLPGLLVFTNAPPIALPPVEQSTESHIARLFAFSRLRQLDVPSRP